MIADGRVKGTPTCSPCCSSCLQFRSFVGITRHVLCLSRGNEIIHQPVDDRRFLNINGMAGPWEDLEAGTRHRVCQELAGLHAWAIALANHDERRSWKVELGVRVTDLTRRGEDDRALAVYFVFGETGDATKGPMRSSQPPPPEPWSTSLAAMGRDCRWCRARTWGTGGSSSSCGLPTDPNGNGCRRASI